MPKRTDEQLLTLPETSSISKSQRLKLEADIVRFAELKAAAEELTEVRDRIKDVLDKYQLTTEDGTSLGVRYKDFCVISRYNAGRKSLDKTLLIENGVTPKQIEASMKEGNGYFVTTLDFLGQNEREKK